VTAALLAYYDLMLAVTVTAMVGAATVIAAWGVVIGRQGKEEDGEAAADAADGAPGAR
jgi:hypothetical protein